MIETWLENFHDAWKSRDVDAVMNLFADDVEYWETPNMLLNNKDEIKKEWQAIREQEDIDVSWRIYSSSDDNRHTIIWSLQYKKLGELHKSSGLYLINLGADGLCHYFYYVGESEK